MISPNPHPYLFIVDETGSVPDNTPWGGDVNQPFFVHGYLRFPQHLQREVLGAHVRCMSETGAPTTHIRELFGASRVAVIDWVLDYLSTIPFDACISAKEGACASTERVYDLTIGLIHRLEGAQVSSSEEAAYKFALHRIVPESTRQALWTAFAASRNERPKMVREALQNLDSTALRNSDWSKAAQAIHTILMRMPFDDGSFRALAKSKPLSNRLNNPANATCIDILADAAKHATSGSIVVYDMSDRIPVLMQDVRGMVSVAPNIHIRRSGPKGETFLIDALLWAIKRVCLDGLTGKDEKRWLSRLSSCPIEPRIRGRLVSLRNWDARRRAARFDDGSRPEFVLSDLRTKGPERGWSV